jgi:hypothetical protein
MADVATLGIRVQSTGAEQATQRLKELQRSAAGAEVATADLERQALRTAGSMARAFAAGAAAGLFAGAVAGLKAMKSELLEIDRVARMANLSLNQVNSLGVLGRMNGLTSAQVNTGITGIAEKLNEARREENELTKLLDANNQKWKDREGNVIGVNAALEVAAGLMASAATNLDRIDIAKKLGLTAEWVPLLENGVRAFAQARAEADALAGTMDQGLVNAAKQFDSAWNSAWTAFGTAAKGEIGAIATGLAGLASQASSFLSRLGQAFQGQFRQVYDQAPAGIQEIPITPSSRPQGMSDATWRTLQGWLRDGRDTSRDFAPWERLRQAGGGGFRSTTIPGSSSGGGGGGGDSESSFDRALRQMQERNALAQKELETMGLSTAQREAALAYERALNVAKRDGETLSAEQLQKLREQSDEYGRIQAALEEAKRRMRELKELSDFAKSTVSGLFTDMLSGIQQGKNVWESFAQAAVNALNKIATKLMDMAINNLWQAAFPQGNMFGGGGGGGLLGALFGGFGGGGGGTFALHELAHFSAKGDAFSNGNIIAFAKGGIVGGPTLFPFAKGTGLMGEAGPEAIMPLRRTASGDLGIIAANSNRPQNVNITVNVEGANGDQHVIDLVKQGVSAGMSQVQGNIIPTVREGIRRGAIR